MYFVFVIFNPICWFGVSCVSLKFTLTKIMDYSGFKNRHIWDNVSKHLNKIYNIGLAVIEI